MSYRFTTTSTVLTPNTSIQLLPQNELRRALFFMSYDLVAQVESDFAGQYILLETGPLSKTSLTGSELNNFLLRALNIQSNNDMRRSLAKVCVGGQKAAFRHAPINPITILSIAGNPTVITAFEGF